MAGLEPAQTAPGAAAAGAGPGTGSGGAAAAVAPPARPALGPVGEAAQLVEAALQARTAASQGQRFATTKTLFFGLSSLSGALRLELRRRDVGQGKPAAALRPDCEACASTLHGVLSDKKLEMTAPFCRSVGECLKQVFELCESMNAVGAVLDVHKLLDNRKASSESKVAGLDALGEISKAAGIRVVSVLPESVSAVAKQIKHLEPLVRATATSALRGLVDGAGAVGSSVHGEALKAAVKAAADRCPDVRVEAYKLCLSLAEAAPNLAAPASPVPLEALVALCIRGLDDESPAARLAAAAATGAALAMGVEGSAAENERLGVIAARDQEQDDDEEGGGNGGSGGGSSASKKLANKLKEMGNDMKIGMTKLGEKKMPTLGDSLTPDRVVQFLSELFRRATFPSPTSREYMAGVAEAFVCLWKRPHMLARVNSSTVPKLVSCVLDLLDTDRLPQGPGETGVVRTAVEYMVREGISAPLPELAQQLVAREMLQILAEVAGSAPPASGFPPLLNEHQIQVCLVELSHLTRALGQACAALKDTLAASLFALLAHPSYGVRFEAAVALASLGSALPWCAAGLLQQCLDEIQQQYDALMEEGILPASPSPPAKADGGVGKPTEQVGEGGLVGARGEPDPDLELDDDAAGTSDGTTVATAGAGDNASAPSQSAGIGGIGGSAGGAGSTGTRGRSTVATKRLRLLLLHGNSAAASLLLQVARELPMGIPSKVAENSFMAAEKLILVQFPAPEPPTAAGAMATAAAPRAVDAIDNEEGSGKDKRESEDDSAEAAMEKGIGSAQWQHQGHQRQQEEAAGVKRGEKSQEDPSCGSLSSPSWSYSNTRSASRDHGGGGGGDKGGGIDRRQHPMGVVCTCVRTGWSLMSSLFCVGEEWAEGHAGRLMELWASCMRGAEDGPAATRLRGLEPAHELILLDASTRALLWFLRSCPNTLCMEPGRMALAIVLMESAVEAVEGRLKSPVKKQGVICRTLLKALLMECFAWLPPGSFPGSSTRLFKWSLDHLKMYTLNDVQSSLLPELLNPDDTVLSVASTAKVPTMSGVGSVVEGEDLDTVLAQVTLVSGVTIGPQERDAMVCSADPWAGRGPSPARRRRAEENIPPTPKHASVFASGTAASSFPTSAVGGGSSGGDNGLAAGGWRRPLPSSASINVRLLDAAVQVFAASFGQQSEESKLEGISGLMHTLPEHVQAAAAAAALAASRGGAKKDASFIMPVLLSEEDRKKRERRHRIAVLNICATLLATLKSMAPLSAEGQDGQASPPRHNIDLPWVIMMRDVLLELLSSADSMVRRSAAESLALMGLKVGDGYAVYLVQDMLKILRKKAEKKKTPEKEAVSNNRRAGAIFALACLKRTMGGQLDEQGSGVEGGLASLACTAVKFIPASTDIESSITSPCLVGGYELFYSVLEQRSIGIANMDEMKSGSPPPPELVVLNWFWMDVQRELSVAGDVVQPVRTWGLHSISLLVKGLDAESNPTQYSEIQEMVKYLNGVVELLEAHFLGSWTLSTHQGSKRSSGSSASSSGSLREGQALSADVPGLASALARLLCTLLPVLQGLRPSRQLVSRFLAMWGVLRHHLDSRVTHGCLELVELLAMFAPADVPHALPEIMPFVQDVLRRGVGGTSPECLVRAAMCVKLIAGRAPEAVEGYRPELELYQCLESVLGSLTWEGAPTWRGVIVSRDVERHFGVRVDAARELEVAIETVVGVDQAGHRPLHWLLFGKALVVGTGHVQLPTSAGGEADGDAHRHSGKVFERKDPSDWHSVVQAARNGLAMFASPLASSRWQVKRSAVRGCVMVLSSLQSGSGQHTDERVACLDVKKARALVTRAMRALSPEPVQNESLLPPRPSWARVPPLLCLFLEDMVTLACAASTASTDDSELLELQEAGVMMLTEVARTFAQVPDSDEHELGLVTVGGKSIRAPSLALELSISQITAAARPALGCKVAPRLAQRGCELVVTLVREGLVKDTVVLRRLVRQVMPEEVLALALKQSGLEKSYRRSRVGRSLSPTRSPALSPGRRSAASRVWGGTPGSRDRRSTPKSTESDTSPVGFGNSGVDVDHLGGVAVEGAAAGAMTAAVDAAVVAEAWSMRVAVEQSLRPKESEVYGVHVPLAERAARLQCLAALSLLAGGEDDACDGGGSGSGAIIPDSVRRGLMDALREHLRVLGLHWLASVKDAVRLNQGDASGLWPSATKPNIDAGLTYPPGVKPSFAKGPLKGRWPAMAAAAAAELNRAVSLPSPTPRPGGMREAGGKGAAGGGIGAVDPEAAPFLLSVCVCGLLAAEEGLSRRRRVGRLRSRLGLVGRAYTVGAGDGFGEAEEEQDEGQTAEDESLMFLTALRCLLARPQLLGDPTVSTASQRHHIADAEGEAENDKLMQEAKQQQQLHDAAPIAMVIRAVRILSAQPFLCTGAADESRIPAAQGNGSSGCCSPRLQLAAISVLRVLVSGDGAKYMAAAATTTTVTAGMTSLSGQGKEAFDVGTEEEREEKREDDAGALALWDAIMNAIVGAVRAVLPAAFEPFVENDSVREENEEKEMGEKITKSSALLAAEAMLALQRQDEKGQSRRQQQQEQTYSPESDSRVILCSLLPLLAKLPPLCPPSQRPAALPSLLLLSTRVLGAVAAISEPRSNVSNPVSTRHKVLQNGAIFHGNGGAAGVLGRAVGPGALTASPEASAAVDFVRSCVEEVWLYGDALRHSVSIAETPIALDGLQTSDNVSGDSAQNVGTGEHVESAAETSRIGDAVGVGTSNGGIAGAGVGGVKGNDGDDDDEDDDWGDEDFQGADDPSANVVDSAPEVELAATEESPSADHVLDQAEIAVPGEPVEPFAESEDVAEKAVVQEEIRKGVDVRESGSPEEQEFESKREERGSCNVDSGNGVVLDEAEGGGEAAKASSDVPATSDNTFDEEEAREDGGDQGSPGTAKDPGDLASAGDSEDSIDLVQPDSGDKGQQCASDDNATAVLVTPTLPSVTNEQDKKTLSNGDVASSPDDGTASAEGALTAAAPPQLSPVVPNAVALVQGVGNAVNELLESLLHATVAKSGRQASIGRHEAGGIGAATEAWGAVALAVPSEAAALASPLQAALSSPAESCSVAVRLALLRGVAVTVRAAEDRRESPVIAGSEQGVAEKKDPGAASSAAETLLRLLAPYVLAALRIEVARAAVVDDGGAGEERKEPLEACLLEGVHITQLAFKTAPPSSHGALLGLLLPLYASALALANLPALHENIGQALLHAARSSAAAFKEAVAYVGTGERQALEGAVRTALLGQRTGGTVGAGGGAVRGQAGGARGSTRKLDLSQYSARG